MRGKYVEITDKKLTRKLIKMEIRSLTIPYAKNKSKKSRELEKQLQLHISLLDDKIAANAEECAEQSEADLQECEDLKKQLLHIYEKRGKDVIIQSKINWIEQVEKPTIFSIWSGRTVVGRL